MAYNLKSQSISQRRTQSEADGSQSSCCSLHTFSCLPYSLTPKMHATCSPEVSVDFQGTTLRYIREVITLLLILYTNVAEL